MTTPNARMTPKQLSFIRQVNANFPSPLVTELLAELDAVTRELDEARKDSARLDWWGRHMHDGPSVGLYTDGRLGLGRGHLVDAKWTVKARPYLTLRDAIDAASESAASNADEKPEAPLLLGFPAEPAAVCPTCLGALEFRCPTHGPIGAAR